MHNTYFKRQKYELQPSWMQYYNYLLVWAPSFCGNLLDCARLADHHTVVLYFCGIRTLAFAMPGDEHWPFVFVGHF